MKGDLLQVSNNSAGGNRKENQTAGSRLEPDAGSLIHPRFLLCGMNRVDSFLVFFKKNKPRI
jgi:hypothetical protein